MKTHEASQNKKSSIKEFAKDLALFFGKVILRIVMVVLIGLVISFAVYYIKGYSLGTVMRIVGVIIALIGLGSQLGEAGLRTDYNYNMAKMRDPKMLENEHNGFMTASSLSFLLWMGSSGIILFLIGDALLRA